jgi:hypothetical protein
MSFTFSGSFGLPTRARAVSEFMVGLEKTKARSGEISQSARALMCEDMCRLHSCCTEMVKTQGSGEQRWGAIRYASTFCSPPFSMTDWGFPGCLPLCMVDAASY